MPLPDCKIKRSPSASARVVFWLLGGANALANLALLVSKKMRRDLGAFAETLISQNCPGKYYDAATAEKAIRGIAADWEYWRGEAAKLPAIRARGEASIRGAQGPVRPADLGYTREDTRFAILYAMELRDKFTVLRLAQLTGRLEGLAEELADEFC